MITLTKLAKEAHVSVSTVSKAFSLSDEVNEQTREEIFDIARRYGCFKKYYRAKYPSIMIAVICPEFKSGYYSSSVSEIARRIREYDCRVCAAETGFSKKEEEELIRYYSVHSKVDGIILVGGESKTIDNSETPIVQIGKGTENIPSVHCDIVPPIREAIEYFRDNGVTDIGFIGEKLTHGKLDAFTNIMDDVFGKADDRCVSISEKRFSEGGYDAAEKIFRDGEMPRGLICAYDEMAFGAIRCIKDHGLSVPDDVAVIGMDDIRISPYFSPPLSSVDSMTDECFERAIRMLTDMIFGGSHGENINLTAKLNLRKSSEIIKRG